MISIKELKVLDEKLPGPWDSCDAGSWGNQGACLFSKSNKRITLMTRPPTTNERADAAISISKILNSLSQLINRLEDFEELRESVLKNEYVNQHKLAVEQEKKWGEK